MTAQNSTSVRLLGRRVGPVHLVSWRRVGRYRIGATTVYMVGPLRVFVRPA